MFGAVPRPPGRRPPQVPAVPLQTASSSSDPAPLHLQQAAAAKRAAAQSPGPAPVPSERALPVPGSAFLGPEVPPGTRWASPTVPPLRTWSRVRFQQFLRRAHRPHSPGTCLRPAM